MLWLCIRTTFLDCSIFWAWSSNLIMNYVWLGLGQWYDVWIQLFKLLFYYYILWSRKTLGQRITVVCKVSKPQSPRILQRAYSGTQNIFGCSCACVKRNVGGTHGSYSTKTHVNIRCLSLMPWHSMIYLCKFYSYWVFNLLQLICIKKLNYLI